MKLFFLLFEDAQQEMVIKKIGAELEKISRSFGGEGNHDFLLTKQRYFLKKIGLLIKGEGADREVYGSDKINFVIKLSLYSTEQNYNEIRRWECAKENGAINCLANIIDYGTDYSWIIMEKATKIWNYKSDRREIYSLMEKSIGLPENIQITSKEDFEYLVKKFSNKPLRGMESKENIDQAIEFLKQNGLSSWFQNFIDNVKECELNVTDFHHGNWGLMSDGRFVLIDYGF